VADRSNQGASGVLNEDVQGDSSMSNISIALDELLMVLNSILVRSLSRFASHDQPFPSWHASSSDWYSP